jgi:hypothetical protein
MSLWTGRINFNDNTFRRRREPVWYWFGVGIAVLFLCFVVQAFLQINGFI